MGFRRGGVFRERGFQGLVITLKLLTQIDINIIRKIFYHFLDLEVLRAGNTLLYLLFNLVVFLTIFSPPVR